MPRRRNPSSRGGSAYSASARRMRRQQRRPVERLEENAVALQPSLHGVHQPARGPHNGHRSVAQGVHLVQAARLVAAGHEEEVRPRLHQVGQRPVEAQVDAHLLGESAPGAPAGRPRSSALAAAHRHEADVRLERGGQHLQQQVDALLPRQPGDDAEHRRVRVRQPCPLRAARACTPPCRPCPAGCSAPAAAGPSPGPTRRRRCR